MSSGRARVVIGLLLVSGLAQSALSGEPGQPADQLAWLESVAAAQQERVAQLQTLLATEDAPNADGERAELLRQQVRDILAEQGFRESLTPALVQAGYDQGFFIRSSDDRFLIEANGLLQFRWTHCAVGSRNRYMDPRLERDDRTGFDIQRIRVYLKGHAYTPNLTYYLQLRSDASQSYNVDALDAYLNYRFCDAFQLRTGIFKLAATESRLVSPRHLQFVDRPMFDAVFGLNRGLGVRLWGQLCERRLEYFCDVVNSFVSPYNRTITPDLAELDNNPGLVFRLLWHALGENPGKDLKVEPDLEYHESPALDLACHYAFNDDDGDRRTISIPFPLRTGRDGGFGVTTTNGLQINQFGLAAAFKWRGFSARGEYVLRLVDPRRAGRTPYAPWWTLTGEDSTVAQHGAYVQMGYFLPIPGLERKLEAVARVGGISALAEDQEGAWEYSAGVNYYIHGNGLKLQAEVTKVTEVPVRSSGGSLANVNDSPLIFRVQLQATF